MIKKKSLLASFVSNVSYAYLSQAISMILSMLFTLILPKFLGVEGYSYWQLIVFYASYLGIFYLGLNDGLYLRIGGMNYEDLDKDIISAESKIFFLVHCFVSALIILISIMFINDENRLFVVCVTAIYLPFFNFKGLACSILQAVNKTKYFSISTIIDKVVVSVFIFIALSLKFFDYRPYVIVYVVGGIVAMFYCCYYLKDIIFAKAVDLKKAWIEICLNIKAGFPLMLSSFAAMLIIGVSRQIIDMRWGIEQFGAISLAISMMNLALVFLNQTSLVLFPAIRRIEFDNQIDIYVALNGILNYVLPGILIFYVPVKVILSMWLPNYINSFEYLGIILPICLFDGKMNLINNTYYKVLRLEKELFAINIATLFINTAFSFVGAYLFNNMMLIVVGLVVSIAFRSIMAELFLKRKLQKQNLIEVFSLMLFTLIFIVVNAVFSQWVSCALYAVAYCIYFIIIRSRLLNLISSMKKTINNIIN